MSEPTTSSTGITTAINTFSGAVSVLLGFATSWLSARYQNTATVKRERESRLAVHRDQLAERRAEFQRQTLIELQDAVFDLMRATGAMHHQDEMAFRKTGQWQKQFLGDELDQKALMSNRRTSMFKVRVRDGSLRDMVGKLSNLCAQVAISIDRDHSNGAMMEAGELFEKVQERIGELIRTINDEEQAAVEA
jgi:hypothetical protein